MKILNWVQSKLNGRHGSKKVNSISVKKNILPGHSTEEFNDWPNYFLAIGTLGNSNLKEDIEERHTEDNDVASSSKDHLQDLTSEEIGTLEKELNSLLQKQANHELATDAELQQAPNYLSLEKFLNRQSSFKAAAERNYNTDESNEKISGRFQRSTSAILSRGKDVCVGNKNNAIIGQKSLSFLLKKMFICRSGFSPAPSLRDPIPELIMEKILRAILHKKIYPQSPSPSPSSPGKKYLENSHMPTKFNKEDKAIEKANAGSKWVKTDSDYIVLEI